ncbi:MAG: hypothetical protein HXY20_15325 [Acidobacteria bacterium]|nr:hypothetical protein [Acidobacteriota bacterium]
MGQQCPHCGGYTFHDRGSYRQCSACRYVGWPWAQPIKGLGPGPGATCPWCKQMTLHDVLTLPHGYVVRRCSTCNYTAVEPPPPEPGDPAMNVD